MELNTILTDLPDDIRQKIINENDFKYSFLPSGVINEIGEHYRNLMIGKRDTFYKPKVDTNQDEIERLNYLIENTTNPNAIPNFERRKNILENRNRILKETIVNRILVANLMREMRD